VPTGPQALAVGLTGAERALPRVNAAGAVLLGSTLLTGATFTVIQGGGSGILLAIGILITMGCLVALTTGVRAGSRGR